MPNQKLKIQSDSSSDSASIMRGWIKFSKSTLSPTIVQLALTSAPRVSIVSSNPLSRAEPNAGSHGCGFHCDSCSKSIFQNPYIVYNGKFVSRWTLMHNVSSDLFSICIRRFAIIYDIICSYIYFQNSIYVYSGLFSNMWCEPTYFTWLWIPRFNRYLCCCHISLLHADFWVK